MMPIDFTVQGFGRYIGQYANLVETYGVTRGDLRRMDTAPLIDLSGDEFDPVIESEEFERKRTIRKSVNDLQRAINKFIEVVPYELRKLEGVDGLIKKSVSLIESSEYF